MKALLFFISVITLGLFASYYINDTLGQIAGAACFVFSVFVALFVLDATLESDKK